MHPKNLNSCNKKSPEKSVIPSITAKIKQTKATKTLKTLNKTPKNFLILAILIVTFVLGVFGKGVLQWLLQNTIGIEKLRTDVISMVSFGVMIGITITAFSGIYTYIPNKKIIFKKQIPGAAFVAAAWGIFTFGFSLYIEYFSGFIAYGTLGTIILFLLWLYFCSYIMLMGAVINWFYNSSFVI